MRKKKYAGELVIGMILGTLVCNTAGIQAAASMPDGTAEMKAVKQTISDEVYSSNLVWANKIENGIKYKRLYDKIKKEWLTDWISLAREKNIKRQFKDDVH